MPYAARKKKGGKVKVVNKKTGRVLAKGTTRAKAKAQMNLLRGVEHGWEPTGKPATPREKISKGLKKAPVSRTRRR